MEAEMDTIVDLLERLDCGEELTDADVEALLAVGSVSLEDGAEAEPAREAGESEKEPGEVEAPETAPAQPALPTRPAPPTAAGVAPSGRVKKSAVRWLVFAANSRCRSVYSQAMAARSLQERNTVLLRAAVQAIGVAAVSALIVNPCAWPPRSAESLTPRSSRRRRSGSSFR